MARPSVLASNGKQKSSSATVGVTGHEPRAAVSIARARWPWLAAEGSSGFSAPGASVQADLAHNLISESLARGAAGITHIASRHHRQPHPPWIPQLPQRPRN